MYEVEITNGSSFSESARDAELDFIDLVDSLMWATSVDTKHDMVNVYKELYRKTVYGVIESDYVIVPFFYSEDEGDEWTRVLLFETDMIDDGEIYLPSYVLPEDEDKLGQDVYNDILSICTLEDWHEL